MSTVGDIQKVKLNEICRFFGPESTVSEIADMNLEKLADRKNRGHLRGSGDNR